VKPRLLDLFCGAGGAAMGYDRAGFDVVGVDIKRQPRYPFSFVQGDALAPPVDLAAFDAIHASPPCQAYAYGTAPMRARGKVYPDLLEPTRDMLAASGVPWVIENTPPAPMRADFVCCGSQFGLPGLIRHRWFEWSYGPPTVPAPPCAHGARTVSVVGTGTASGCRWWWEDRPEGVTWKQLCEQAMGIDWMTRAELSQAIPPAYTEWIGRQLLEQVRRMAW
jgi:DNA (cytosine-5)-methyltransferase 1